MLRQIKIQGYRSFNDISLRLRPLNVLIGPNGCGKTNFLDLFALLKEAADGGLAEGVKARGGMRSLLWAGGAKEIQVEFETEESDPPRGKTPPLNYRLTIASAGSAPVVLEESLTAKYEQKDVPFKYLEFTEGKGYFAHHRGEKYEHSDVQVSPGELAIAQVKRWKNYPVLSFFREYLSSWTFYSEFRTGPNDEIRRPQFAKAESILSPNGDNLTTVLHYFSTLPPREGAFDPFDEVEWITQAVYPEFEGLSFSKKDDDGRITLHWHEKPFQFSAADLSDGALRLLCLTAITENPQPPPLILIDRPELGIHPSSMQLVAELLQSLAYRTQVIVTTYSPQLLNYLEIDEVVLMGKRDGATIAQRLEDYPNIRGLLREDNIGDTWMTGYFDIEEEIL